MVGYYFGHFLYSCTQVNVIFKHLGPPLPHSQAMVMCMTKYLGLYYLHNVGKHSNRPFRSALYRTLLEKVCLKGSSFAPCMEPFMALKGATKGS